MKRFIFTLVMLLAASTSTRAGVITQWTLETAPFADLTNSTTIGSIAADVGSGTASGVHASAATDWTTPAGNGSANSFSSNNWGIGDYYQFATSTLGFEDVDLFWDHTSSGTGPQNFDLQYSTTGEAGIFTTAFSYLVNPTAPAAPDFFDSANFKPGFRRSLDLTAITALDNVSQVIFRLVNTTTTPAGAGPFGAGGTSRIDNFTVNANAMTSGVPEPSSMLLSGVAFAGAALVRRRRKAQADAVPA